MERNDEREWVLWDRDARPWQTLAADLDVHPLTARILYRRGFRDPDAALAFLDPTLRSMHDPFLMKGMHEAVRVTLTAIERGESIIIHGDYDVDGVCSVSVLYSFLHELGANVDYFVPRREQDGYGLNAESVRRFHAAGYGLIVTTDCGVSNVEEIRLARELGMRVVVVDHHTIPEVLPPANAILNPHQADCAFPFNHLAAVGVTFNFVVALRSSLRERGIFRSIPEPDLRRYLDLVALGTVADVVPLVDENRLFVKLGLEVLAGRRRAGISALMDRSAIEVGPVSARTISFRLAPRINAAGRMGDASMCVELLTTRDYGRATQLAERLDDLNRSRQQEERGILEAAIEQAEVQTAQDRRILVVAGQDWHRGVLGIIASRLMERYHRPAILMGIEDGMAKGSARSIAGINLIEILHHADDLLATYGGHSLAAGLSLVQENLASFHDVVDEALQRVLESGNLPRPRLELDGVVDLSEIDRRFFDELVRLGPFGSGNPEPLFLCARTVASNVRVVGDRHLRARFRDGNRTLDGFGFAMGDEAATLSGPIAVAFIPRLLFRRGRPQLELQLKGVRPASAEVHDRVDRSDD